MKWVTMIPYYMLLNIMQNSYTLRYSVRHYQPICCVMNSIQYGIKVLEG